MDDEISLDTLAVGSRLSGVHWFGPNGSGLWQLGSLVVEASRLVGRLNNR